MREDKIFCSQKCASSESKRNYVLNNPERVRESKIMHYEKIKSKKEYIGHLLQVQQTYFLE